MEVTMTFQFKRSMMVAAAGLSLMSATAQSPAQDQAMPAPGAHRMAFAERNEIVRALREQFGEKPVAHGLADTGVLAEIFSGPQGTWTIVATSPNGVSCLIGSGQSFQTALALDEPI
jgi:hypothetical protein